MINDKYGLLLCTKNALHYTVYCVFDTKGHTCTDGPQSNASEQITPCSRILLAAMTSHNRVGIQRWTERQYQLVSATTPKPNPYIKWRGATKSSVCFRRQERDLLYQCEPYSQNIFITYMTTTHSTTWRLWVIQFSDISDQLLLSITPVSSVS